MLFIFDVTTDFIVGYDLFQNCHTMYSAAAFAFCAFPGFLEGLHRMATQTGPDFGKAIALVFLPFWMIPYTGWTLIKDVYRTEKSTLISAKK